MASGKICGRSTGNDAEFNLLRDKGVLEILRGSTSVDDLILKLSLLDFVVEHDGKVLPIEVKSGKGYTRHTALDNAMRVEEYSIPEAFVFCTISKIMACFASSEGEITSSCACAKCFFSNGT